MEELKNLIVRAQAGDPDAYGGIVRRFQDMAVAYGYSILGDFHLAQDAAQEAFVEAYFALPKLREAAAFSGWFGRIVFKQCDRLTRGKRVATVPLGDAVELAARDLDPPEAAARAEAQAEVRAAIRALPEKERAVTALFYISDYSHQEIGRFLDIPISTVKNRLHSARKRLRERMIAKVKENLHEQRPSQSESFAAALARKIFVTSNLRGQFRLRSGIVSDEYFDKYLFESDPVLLREIAEAMTALIPENTDALAGLEMGGIPLATVLSQITGLPALFVRKAAKEYGTCKLAEGGEVAGRNLVIIEDVVTSGGQIRESSQALRELGGRIVRVLCVIDRQSGGVENLAANGLELAALFTMAELKGA